MSTNAATARSAGFALLSRINRWLIAAAVALAGFLSLLASHAFHGRTQPTNRTASPALSQTSQPPAAAPSQAAPAPVVSGGS